MDTYTLLFLAACIVWILLAILYSIDVDEQDDFYQGCYESLLAEVGKKKDNL